MFNMIKKFVKGGKRISAKRAVLTAVFIDFTDIVTNLIAAIITGSVVMLAETLHGVADFFSSGFVYLGLKRSQKTNLKKYPFGKGKALYVWVFISGIIMFGITSVLIFYFGLQNFLNPEQIEHIWLAFTVLILFIFTNGYALSVSFRRILHGKKIRSFIKVFRESNLVETKTTFVLDCIGTLAAVFGLMALGLYQITGDLRFDGIGAMAIALTMASLTIFLIMNTGQMLIGRRASKPMEKQIKKTIVEMKDVKSVPDLKTMNIGLGKILVIAEVSVNQKLTTKKIENLIDKIKANVQKKIPEVSHIQIEIETSEKHVRIKAEK